MAKLLTADPQGSRAGRDAGMDIVFGNTPEAWKDQVRRGADRLPSGWVGTTQHLRVMLSRFGVPPPPHHHNAWGPMTNELVRLGLLTKLRGAESHSILRQCHRSHVTVYVRTRIRLR
jgi:hypothetical protein